MTNARRIGESSYLLVLVASFVWLQRLDAQDVMGERHAVSDDNRRVFLQHVEPLLSSPKRAVRVYYRADCWTENGDGIVFPRLRLEDVTRSKTGLSAMRDLFRREDSVKVIPSTSGLYRISIGKVGYQLLSTKIHMLRLRPVERFDAEAAIRAIEETDEVRAKKTELKLQEAPMIFFGSPTEPAAGLPHLPESMTDITVDEALDRVAKTFKGIVLYGECDSADGTRLFAIEFEYVK